MAITGQKIINSLNVEAVYDPDINTHHHFRCIRCNSIRDFHDKNYDNIAVPEEINKQFTALNKRVVLEGLCNKCRRR